MRSSHCLAESVASCCSPPRQRHGRALCPGFTMRGLSGVHPEPTEAPSMRLVLPASTDRLRFREMTEADLDEIDAVLSAPDPARPGRRQRTRADAERWIEWNRQSYAEHGYGLWVIETHEGRFVGDCGLTVQDVEGEPHIEVGYHVHLALRGQGFASEAAASVLDAARAAGVPSSSPSFARRTCRPSTLRRRSGFSSSGASSRTAATPSCSALFCRATTFARSSATSGSARPSAVGRIV